ncbi:MAG: phosphatase PAP2 family protein [Promethearchaeota archaeon]
MVLFDIIWTELLRDLFPWAVDAFKLITELGSSAIYLAIILIIFWGIDKRLGMVTTFVYIGSSILNYWVKAILKYPRPAPSQWLTSAANYSLPSGHAQSATTFYGWLTLKINRWWMFIIGTTLIILVGISRIYLGVHWLGDVLLGWGIGIVIIILVWRFENPISDYLSKYNTYHLYIGLVILGGIAMVLTELMLPVPTDNFGGSVGIVIGIGIGLALEKKFVNFTVKTPEKETWKIFLRISIGLILVLVVYYGTSLFLSSEDVLTAALLYCLIALVGAFVWPLIFSKIDL